MGLMNKLDLRMHSQNGTCSYVGDLLYINLNHLTCTVRKKYDHSLPNESSFQDLTEVIRLQRPWVHLWGGCNTNVLFLLNSIRCLTVVYSGVRDAKERKWHLTMFFPALTLKCSNGFCQVKRQGCTIRGKESNVLVLDLLTKGCLWFHSF